MNWNTVTVRQYQAIFNVLNTPVVEGAPELTELEQGIKLISILHGLPEDKVEAMAADRYMASLKDLEFLHTEKMIPAAGAKYFRPNTKRRYRFTYDIRKMRIARIAEIKTFADQGLIPNLHRLAASFVVPQRRNCLGLWVDESYDASVHSDYADDMLGAPLVQVYGSIVFFCRVYVNSMASIRGYLISNLQKTGMETGKAEKLVADLCETLAGYIRLH